LQTNSNGKSDNRRAAVGLDPFTSGRAKQKIKRKSLPSRDTKENKTIGKKGVQKTKHDIVTVGKIPGGRKKIPENSCNYTRAKTGKVYHLEKSLEEEGLQREANPSRT